MSKKSQPSKNGKQSVTDMRDNRGRFLPGNVGGPGNPGLANVQRHRAAMFAAAKDDDAAKALAVLRDIMLDGDARKADRIAAAEKLLDRLIGRPVPLELDGEEPARQVRMYLATIVNQLGGTQ